MVRSLLTSRLWAAALPAQSVLRPDCSGTARKYLSVIRFGLSAIPYDVGMPWVPLKGARLNSRKAFRNSGTISLTYVLMVSRRPPNCMSL